MRNISLFNNKISIKLSFAVFENLRPFIYSNTFVANLIAPVILLVFISYGAASADDGRLYMKSRDLRIQKSDHMEIVSYDIQVNITLNMPGMQQTFIVHNKALRPDNISTTTLIAGNEQVMISNVDSLWTINNSHKTYTSVSWDTHEYPIKHKLSSYFELLEPPYSFATPLQSLSLDIDDDDDTYVFVCHDTLSINSILRECEVWNYEPNTEVMTSSTIWIDKDTRLLLRNDWQFAKMAGQLIRGQMEVTTFLINSFTDQEAFIYYPPMDYRRVSDDTKLRVDQCIEGLAPGNYTLRDIDGNEVITREWRGRPVLVDFWATWCVPCLKTIPILEQVKREYGDNVLVVGITSDTMQNISEFVKNQAVSYPILIDEKMLMTADYRVSSIPALYVLSTDGTIQDQYVGIPNLESIRESLGKMGLRPENDSGSKIVPKE